MMDSITLDFWMGQILKYFPKNINPYSVEYDLSSEISQKAEYISKRRSEISESWEAALESLSCKFEIEDVTPVFDSNLSNYFTFRAGGVGYFKGHVIFSLLRPVHVFVFTMEFSCGLDLVDKASALMHANEQNDVLRDCDIINEALFNFLQSVEGATKDFKRILIESVQTQNTVKGYSTLFDLVFSDSFIMY